MKCSVIMSEIWAILSPPSRGAWIEIPICRRVGRRH